MSKSKELREALAERSYWRRVGEIIGATLLGWTYRSSASFLDPDIHIDGCVAEVLLKQQNTIKDLRKQIKHKTPNPKKEE